MIEITPKKSLGQNFLTDRNTAKKIVGLLDVGADDYVIEIGPGTGALTGLLLEAGADLVCVEIDKRAVETLKSKYPAEKVKNLMVYNEDFMKFCLSDAVKNKRAKIIGNLPYYLTSGILFRILESRERVERAVLTMQREVAQRLTAKIRTKDYGILTVAVNLLGRAKIEFSIPPSCFYPKPKVTSSVVSLSFGRAKGPDRDAAHFDYINSNYADIMKLVRASFNYRRKTLSNALKGFIEAKPGAGMGLLQSKAGQDGIGYFSKRAEELSPVDFVELYRFISNPN